ncbi:MAG: class I adenylate-forming enzyme family protein [Alphaproteobacteria bacterium]|nr:class I adenylate-forming enzyme family protein [Alphaproteobacteria bacterium]
MQNDYIILVGIMVIPIQLVEHKVIIMMKNIYEMLQDVCSRNKDSIFLVRQNETYADLLKRVKQRAVLLAKRFGIKKGDTVAILSGNTPDFLRSYFAIASQGARALMLDTGLNTTEHINMMRRTDCKLVLAQKSMFIDDAPCEMFDIENIDDTDEQEFVMAETERGDIAQLSFTSGSTGNPKVVGLTHANLLSLSDGAQFYKTVIHPGYTFYGFLPLYHIYGVVINIIVPVALQGKLLLQPILKPQEFIKDFKQYKPEVIPAVPRIWEVFYKKIVDSAREKHVWTLMRMVVSMRKILRAIGLEGLINKVTKPVHDAFGGNTKVLVSAGATLKPSIRKFYENMGFVVGDCYGLTETCGPANFNFAFRRPDGSMHYAGPLLGNEIQIHNPDKHGIGEIWVRGNMVMPGYLENDAANADAFEQGWFKTGDIGCLDKYGRLTVKGRQKQVIVLDSGKNVYPDELEDLYMQNDEILNAAVFEYVIKDKTVPFAVFQVKPGTTVERVAFLLKKSNVQIAQYKWVKHFAITEEELPSTSARKVKHFAVRDLLNQGAYTRAK